MDDEPPAVGALQWLLETGEASDVIISTSTKDFKVHSFILKHKSPYFSAGFSSQFAEPKGDRIFLEENETVVKALIQRMYELDVDILKDAIPVYDTADGAIMRQEFEDIVNLILAADKYQLATLEGPAWVFACGRIMHLGSVMDLVELGSWVFGCDNRGLVPLHDALAQYTALRMKEIQEDDKAWAVLWSNEKYSREVIRVLPAKIGW